MRPYLVLRSRTNKIENETKKPEESQTKPSLINRIDSTISLNMLINYCFDSTITV